MTTWPDVPGTTAHTIPRRHVWPPAGTAQIPPAPLPHVIREVAALRNLPHRTILRVQGDQAAQIINDDTGHYVSYAGTDLTDSLDPTDLFWDRSSMDSLIRMLPAVILEQPH